MSGRPTEYTALAYQTYTGKVYAELPLASTPTWAQGINDEGSFTAKVSIGHTGPYPGLSKSVAKTAANAWFSSVAILWGDIVCIAGPVIDPDVDEDATELTLIGKGIWEMLNGRLMTHKDYDPLVYSLLHPAADVVYDDNLPNIAQNIVRDTLVKTNDVGSTLPLTVEANIGTGTNHREYFGYEMAYAGTRLKEITQVENGPDVLFTGNYNDTIQYVTHRMRVGRPYLTQGGDPVRLDFGSNLFSVKENRDGKKFAQRYYAKGSGDKRDTKYAWNGFNDTLSRGYPQRHNVDTTHASAETSDALQGWANANQVAYGNGTVRHWTARVTADVMEIAKPGWRVELNMQGHGWIDDGIYQSRILEWGQTAEDDDGLIRVDLEVPEGGY